MCGVKTKPVRVTSALEESDLMAGGGFGQGGAGIQMNAMNAAGFESGSDIQIFGSDGFQTFGSGKDVFVSENVGECCGSYPKRYFRCHFRFQI